MKFRTLADLNSLIYKNISKIPNDVDLIVGIPRSGLLVANIISLYLNLPLTDINSLLNGNIYESGTTKIKEGWIKKINDARKILVVEDSSLTGNSLNKLKEQIANSDLLDKIIILTIYVTDDTKRLADLYFEICNPPRTFEWNFMHNSSIKKACFDIDGVLCDDPMPEQNDDGKKYIEFVRNAPLKIAPTFEIGYLITSRLEKYREDTEYWLKKNNIKYKNLIMMPFNTKEERTKSGSHGKFKGENYKKLKETNLFIESELNQAIEIAKISGKTVFCTETHEVINENTKKKIKSNLKYKVNNRLRRY